MTLTGGLMHILAIQPSTMALTVVWLVGSANVGHAGDADTFMIVAASGYGVEDCLGEGGECGRIVADAWCEAHGHGVALKFGRSAQQANSKAEPPAPSPYFITCGD